MSSVVTKGGTVSFCFSLLSVRLFIVYVAPEGAKFDNSSGHFDQF